MKLQKYNTLIFIPDKKMENNSDFESAVNKSIKDPRNSFSHVALKLNAEYCLEATTNGGIKVTNIKEFPERVEIKTTLPIKKEYKHLLGRPYNACFNETKYTYYCSSLITYLFDIEHIHHPLMYGKTQYEIEPFWIEYFKNQKAYLDLNQKGIHPGILYMFFQDKLNT